MPTKTERKPLEFYLGLKYPITIIPDVSGGYVAEIEDLPGCMTQGETLEETFGNMEEARRLWIESAYEDRQDIPAPKADEEYSGKFLIRTPKSLHRKLYHMASEEGVSLNQFLVSTLAQAVGYIEARQESKAQSSNRKTKAKVI
jgi:predicted RNase H-like HicB family nuclease